MSNEADFNDMAVQLVRKAEAECAHYKRMYEELEKTFMFNYNLIKERDRELEQLETRLREADEQLRRREDYEGQRHRASVLEDENQQLRQQLKMAQQESRAANGKAGKLAGDMERLLLEDEKQRDKISLEEQKYAQLLALQQRTVEELSELKRACAEREAQSMQARVSQSQKDKDLEAALGREEILRGKLEMAQKVFQEMKAKLQETTDDNRKLSSEYTEQRKRLAAAAESGAQSERLVGELADKYKGLKERVKELQAECQAARSAAHETQERLDKYAGEQLQKTENYEAMARKSAETLLQKEAQIQQLQKQMQQLDRQYVERISATQATANVQTQDLAGQLDKTLKANADFLRENQSLRQQIQALQLVAQEQKQEIQASAQSSLKQQITKMSLDMQEAAATNGQLKTRLEAALQDADAVRKRAKDVENELQEARTAARKAEQRVVEIQTQALRPEDQGLVEELRKMLQQAGEYLREQAASNEALAKENLALKEEMACLRQRLSDAQRESIRRSVKSAQDQAELEAAQSTPEQLKPPRPRTRPAQQEVPEQSPILAKFLQEDIPSRLNVDEEIADVLAQIQRENKL